jgi:hypothetical protein
MMRAPLRRVILAPGQRFTAAAKVACASSRSFAAQPRTKTLGERKKAPPPVKEAGAYIRLPMSLLSKEKRAK